MALDFPNSPTLNQLFAGPNAVQWQWDGSKWIGTPNTLGPVIVAASPPTFQAGQLWWDSTGGQLYLGYADADSQAWVPASNITGLANAATKADVATALNNVGRNLIHNSVFNIWQRGAGPFTVTANIAADRWWLDISSDTASVTQAALSDGARTQIGDEAAVYAMQNAFTGNAAAGAYTNMHQRIEGVRRLSGKTIILSFYATAGSALKLGINLAQVFGSGGSPSAALWVLATGASVTLSTSWTRYSVTIPIPSTAGKTLGTNNNDYTQLTLACSSGANSNATNGNIGVQSGVVALWGVQLEIAQPGQTQPTPLEKRDPVYELQQAQRFFQTGYIQATGYQAAGAGFAVSAFLQATLRSNTVTALVVGAPSLTNMPSVAVLGSGAGLVIFQGVATATGPTGFALNYTVSADL